MRAPTESTMVERVGLGVAITAGLGLMIVMGLAGGRVASLESNELSASSDVIAAPAIEEATLPLLEASLRRDDEVVFEICSSSAMDSARWSDRLNVSIVRNDPAVGDVDVLRASLDASMLDGARRSGAGSCLDVGRGVIEFDGPYRTELSWSSALPDEGVRFRARTLARRSLTSSDRNLVFALLSFSVVLTLALYARRLSVSERANPPLRVALGISLLAAAVLWSFMRFVTPYLPGGAAGGLVSGLALTLIELLLAFALVFRARLDVLGLGREPIEGTPLDRARPYALLCFAPFAGFVLFRIAGFALRFVPASGEAPIEAFVSWPSGMLSFAALAVVAPLAEEVFFRGLVYGVVLGDGKGQRPLLAFGLSWMVFALVHLPQTWGSWGGVLSIAIAALGFTALRAVSGSVLVPALAHLVYNGLLSAQALISASS